MIPYALRHKGRIAAALAALGVAATATLAVPVAVRRMIDYGFSSSGAGLIDAYFAVMVAVVGVLALASGARFYLVATLGERVVADLRDAVFRHLTTLDASFFDVTHTGELLSRLTADTTQIKSAIGASASVALRNSFMFLGAVVMMVVSSPNTAVGERGVTLSGGQRQRLAIARAVLKGAPVLLLDEATSALDAENETAVQTKLNELMRNRTTLVIAHRLATVLSADRILVFDGGRIVEEGTHAELVEQHGLYERLPRLQFETGAVAFASARAAE